ncbi:hypothetical protein PIIN_03579 [Serendipita indica DSM 11827]|uniref:Uncharacterized protein n=1 Tax=Serendipita indica (strain DSM 11827) TaxID=1109443 RepID=G4TE81_SERID|nr:hypothetical protein PIIN_03579 [Serendipita indica DSM 11827]
MLRLPVHARHFVRTPCQRALGRFIRHASSTIVKYPPSSAPREAPTPLVFPSVRGWGEQESKRGIDTQAAMLRELGYTTVEIELDTYSKPSERVGTLHDILSDYAKELHSEVKLASLFPPVIISRGIATMVAQAYVESYPLSALVLVGQTLSYPIQLPDAYKRYASTLRRDKKYPDEYETPTWNWSIGQFPFLMVEAIRDPKRETECMDFGMPLDLAMLDDDGLKDQKKLYDVLRSWLDHIGI